jgi:hypothetical protein
MKSAATTKKGEVSVEKTAATNKKEQKSSHIQKVTPQKGAVTVSDPGCRPTGT